MGCVPDAGSGCRGATDLRGAVMAPAYGAPDTTTTTRRCSHAGSGSGSGGSVRHCVKLTGRVPRLLLDMIVGIIIYCSTVHPFLLHTTRLTHTWACAAHDST